MPPLFSGLFFSGPRRRTKVSPKMIPESRATGHITPQAPSFSEASCWNLFLFQTIGRKRPCPQLLFEDHLGRRRPAKLLRYSQDHKTSLLLFPGPRGFTFLALSCFPPLFSSNPARLPSGRPGLALARAQGPPLPFQTISIFLDWLPPFGIGVNGLNPTQGNGIAVIRRAPWFSCLFFTQFLPPRISSHF